MFFCHVSFGLSFFVSSPDSQKAKEHITSGLIRMSAPSNFDINLESWLSRLLRCCYPFSPVSFLFYLESHHSLNEPSSFYHFSSLALPHDTKIAPALVPWSSENLETGRIPDAESPIMAKTIGKTWGSVEKPPETRGYSSYEAHPRLYNGREKRSLQSQWLIAPGQQQNQQPEWSHRRAWTGHGASIL